MDPVSPVVGRARAARAWVGGLPAGYRDAAIAALVVLLSCTPGLADKGTALGWPAPQRPFGLLAVGLVLGQALPLALRSRAAGVCLALSTAAFLVHQGLGYRATFASVAVYLALYSAGMLQARRRVLTAVLWTGAFVAACAWMIRAGSPFPPGDFAMYFALPAGCWLLGLWSRARLHEQGRRHRERLAAELDEERERIARELHDVVTHHVTAMVMQADAARYVPAGDRAKVDAGLAAIGSTGRHALADLRELLGLLSPGHDARPTKEPPVGRLADLVERAQAAGQPVELDEEPSTRAIGDLTRLAVYRVVQEGLTNALKHAPGRPTIVRLKNVPPEALVVEVSTEGGDGPDPRRTYRSESPGRGLRGLRRRVSLTGGDFSAERTESGGFVLSARFPARGEGR